MVYDGVVLRFYLNILYSKKKGIYLDDKVKATGNQIKENLENHPAEIVILR